MYKGVGVSAGVGTGKAVIVEEAELVIIRQPVSDGEAEIERFRGTLEQTIQNTEHPAKDLATRMGEKEAEIMQGHTMLLTDPVLADEIENSIKNNGVNNRFATENVYSIYADTFASIGDELTQQRVMDMCNIKTRMRRTLIGIQSADIPKLVEGSAIIAKDLTPFMTAGINPANMIGIVIELEDGTSHNAILIRTLEVPAVVAATGLMDNVKDGNTAVLDDSTGEVHVNPEDSVKSEYKTKREAFLKEKKELEQYIGKVSATKDSVQVEIVANIGKPEDTDRVLQYDGERVGLFRTEPLPMDRTAMSAEEEQLEAYKQVAPATEGKPVITCTLDIGGDKEIPHIGLEKDENLFLDYRAIRFCLDRGEDIYESQLRALLRVGAFGSIGTMVPLVTCIKELRETKVLVEEVKKELDGRSAAYNRDIQIGIMVETAVASLVTDIFTKEAGFFSIDTNDLTQYTMSVNRDSKGTSYLYSTFNSAVSGSIRRIIVPGCEASIMVDMCDEAVSDPAMIPLPLALGLNEFGMNTSAILRARKVATEYDTRGLKAVADRVISSDTAAEMEQYMREFVENGTV